MENAPAFEAIAIDEKGGPLRLVVPDPRIFAAHNSGSQNELIASQSSAVVTWPKRKWLSR
ncbi:nucleotidyltransferase domain-containing protein [Mesorhizobium sp. M0768]